jgi:hypothetical protein
MKAVNSALAAAFLAGALVATTAASSADTATRCVVPRAVGSTLTAAKGKILRARCAVGTVRRTAGHKNRVLSQTPKAHRTMKARGRVNLVVGRGFTSPAPDPPPAAPPPPPPPPQPPRCAASYPTLCIPPPPPDLNCADIAYQDFTVLWTVPDPDPHHFDGDKDGIGCESSPPPPPPPPPPPSPPSCAASYPSVCIPPPPPDLNCADIPYTNFTVLWNVPDPDPHHFDGDKDGIGCES